MNAPIDLDAYFERIRFGAPIRRDRETIAALLNAHMSRIPFENLDVLLGRPIRLDLEGLQAKLVDASRGGYCFEHVHLFAAVLEALGFRPRRHSARVVMVNPPGEAPRSHMFLSVTVGRHRYVLDPGFGALAPRLPVPLRAGEPACLGDECHLMSREAAGRWSLRAHTPRRSVQAWVSTLEDELPIDFVVANHYTSTHPASAFVNRLMLRSLTADGSVSVMNRDLTIQRGAQSESRQIADRTALRELLVDAFGFDLPEVEQLRVPSIPQWQ